MTLGTLNILTLRAVTSICRVFMKRSHSDLSFTCYHCRISGVSPNRSPHHKSHCNILQIIVAPIVPPLRKSPSGLFTPVDSPLRPSTTMCEERTCHYYCGCTKTFTSKCQNAGKCKTSKTWSDLNYECGSKSCPQTIAKDTSKSK